jgi:hypothetical protein
MPDKKATYRIDESLLRNTLLGYTVEVDMAHCSVIEQEASAIRMQKTFTMPDTKVLVKFVAIPVLIIASGVLLYANIDSLQEAFTPTPRPEPKAEKKVMVATPVVNTSTVNAVVKPVPPPVQNVAVVKKDTVIVANKNESSRETAKPVVAGPPTDTVTKTESIAKNNVDTVSQKSEAPVKKKKKRRRRSSNIDDLKESTLQPNSADDDVVVPQ